MRDILFKAKRKDDGKWQEGYYQKRFDTFGDIEQLIFYSKSSIIWGYVEVDENTLCQYTGLTDKSGNKIWENDVVWIGGTDRAIVIFSEKHSGYILQPIGDFYFDSPMLADNLDIIDNVIGNIFDNPEIFN